MRAISRAGAAVAVVLLAVLTGWLPVGSAAARQPVADVVQVTVLSVTPTTPAVSTKPQPLVVMLQLTNTTDKPLGKLTVKGERGNPISNQTALDSALANPQPPDASLEGNFTAKPPVTTTLGAGATQTVSYSSSTSNNSDAGLCLCEDRIYPLYLTVLDNAGKTVGSTQTFIPSFPNAPAKPVRVSWVWPILEQPHRTVHDTVFTDDDLAQSVAGGRLDRLLAVVDYVAEHQLPMTVLIDPDLIDELAVMSTGKYTVTTGAGHSTAGAGASVAQAWLLRLRAALDADPELELAFTPYADPDVDSLTRNGLGWSVKLNAAAQTRVSSALGGRLVPTDIAWPVGGTLSRPTVAALARKGTKTIIVDDATLSGGTKKSPRPDALAPIRADGQTATAAVTSGVIEQFASDVVSTGGPGLAALPQLVSEVAVRAEEDSAHSHYVVITPPRNVDPDPAIAERAITDTAQTSWSQPIGLRKAGEQVKAVPQGRITEQAGLPGLPEDTIAAAQLVARMLPGITAMFPNRTKSEKTESEKLLGALPAGLQRSESSEWSEDPPTGVTRAQAISRRVNTVIDGVGLVNPTTENYTLGSEDSPLPITIDNKLDATVSVRIQVSTVGGLPGLSAHDLAIPTIDPLSKLQVHIPLHVDRAGRIKVQVQLLTPNGDQLGAPLPLSVRSTALGNIGKIITYGAGAVLAAALLFRVYRRWRKHRRALLRSAAA